MAQKSPDDISSMQRHVIKLVKDMELSMKSALKVGGIAGLSGILVGSFWGIARSAHPVVFAVGLGIQSFTLGTTSWASRDAILRFWGEVKVSPGDRVSASGMAGCFGGGCLGLLNSFAARRKGIVIPAMNAALFGLSFAAGQKVYNIMDARRLARMDRPVAEKRSWMDSKWSPITILTNEKYEERLEAQLLRVDAEIAIIDENIQALRSQKPARTGSEEASD